MQEQPTRALWVDDEPAAKAWVIASSRDRDFSMILLYGLAQCGDVPSCPEPIIGICPWDPWQRLSYEAAVHALDLQERSVEQLRARTGTLLAASSLTASFLGAQTIQHSSGLGTLGGLALVALACSILLRTYVLLPKSGFVFSLNAPTMYESLFEVADDEHEVHRRLVYWLEEFWQANQAKSTPSDATTLPRPSH